MAWADPATKSLEWEDRRLLSVFSTVNRISHLSARPRPLSLLKQPRLEQKPRLESFAFTRIQGSVAKVHHHGRDRIATIHAAPDIRCHTMLYSLLMWRHQIPFKECERITYRPPRGNLSACYRHLLLKHVQRRPATRIYHMYREYECLALMTWKVLSQ